MTPCRVAARTTFSLDAERKLQWTAVLTPCAGVRPERGLVPSHLRQPAVPQPSSVSDGSSGVPLDPTQTQPLFSCRRNRCFSAASLCAYSSDFGRI